MVLLHVRPSARFLRRGEHHPSHENQFQPSTSGPHRETAAFLGDLGSKDSSD
jgi:hypothetical protein